MLRIKSVYTQGYLIREGEFMRRGLFGAILGFVILISILNACVRQVPTSEYATLTIQTNEAVTILKGQVQYDPAALTFVGVNSLIATGIAEASATDGSLEFGFVSQDAVQGEVLELVFTGTRKGATASLVSLSTVKEDESEVPLSLDGASWEKGSKQNPYISAESAELAASAVTTKPVLKVEFANNPLGDFNKSSRVNLLDALQLTVALLTKAQLNDYQLYHADISGNGVINSEDVKGIIAKAVNPNLPAILRVAPKQLDLSSETTGLVLIGNAGNKPLPRITTSTNPGNLPVQLTNITPQNAIGKAYELRATGSGTGRVIFDARNAGSSSVNIAIKSVDNPTKIILALAKALDAANSPETDINKVRELGITAVPNMLALLNNENVVVRYVAAYGLNGVLSEDNLSQAISVSGVSKEVFVDMLDDGLDDVNLSIQILTAATLLRFGDEDGLGILREAVNSNEFIIYSSPLVPISVFANNVLNELGLVSSSTNDSFEEEQYSNMESLVSSPTELVMPNLTVVKDGILGKKPIDVEIFIEFFGNGATQRLVSSWERAIESNWQALPQFNGCDVKVSATTTFSGKTTTNRQGYHQIEIKALKPGEFYDSHVYIPSADTSNHQWVGGRGTWGDKNPNNTWIAAHEAGHLMGLRDEYKELPRAPDGSRRTVPLIPGSIMSEFGKTGTLQAHSDGVVNGVGAICDHPPDAQLTARPSSGNAPLNVTLDASASTDDRKIVSYSFDFGDGTTPRTSATPIVRHTYSKAGTYTATVTAIDEFEQTDKASATVEVTDVQEYIGTFEYVYSLDSKQTDTWEGLSCGPNPQPISGTQEHTHTISTLFSATVVLRSSKGSDGNINFRTVSLESGSYTSTQQVTDSNPVGSSDTKDTIDEQATGASGEIVAAPNGSATGSLLIDLIGTQTVVSNTSDCTGTFPSSETKKTNSLGQIFPGVLVQGTLGSDGSYSGTFIDRNSDTEKSQFAWQITPK